jgi:2-polyprenyl-3-methyl-5-hydroxy-6-metoxy-1,4-benzoquinol methylase
MGTEAEIYIPGKRITCETYLIHLPRYVFTSKFIKNNMDILDIATGSGYGASYLSGKGARNVVGADRDADIVQIANINYRKPNLSFMLANAEELPFSNESFDIVCSMGTIDHLENPDKFLAGSKRIMRNGGYFICSVLNREVITPSPFQQIIDPCHKIEYSPEELADLAGRYFNNVQLYYQRSGNTRLIKTRRAMYFLLCRKLHLPNAFIILLQRFLWLSGNRDLRYMTYSEEAIDMDFTADNEWIHVNSTKMPAGIFNYLVVGQKETANTF